MGIVRAHVISQGSQSLLLYQPTGHSVFGQKMYFKIECNSIGNNWAATIYLNGGDFKHGGDSHCFLRSLQLLMVCVDGKHLFQSFEKKNFMHKCPTSVSGERAKHRIWGSESTRQVIGP